jgi:TolB-like protein/class 3 adenylate cyclase
MPTERRLAAIMFTDIVGYTALMAESEEQGHRVREQHRQILRPLVEQHHGEWVQDIGDESLSSFPSAADAVNCALAIQQALEENSELTVRIGIHTGDVVERDGSLHGDGVNIASRIRPLAGPGGICVSDEVQHSIRNQPDIETRSLGEHQLKNVGRPLAVYAVGRPGKVVGGQLPRRAVKRSLSLVAALAVVVVAALGWWTFIRPAADAGAIRSIAVLPLENLGSPEQEYVADGVTDALIESLARVGPELRVISRTTMMQYKGTTKSSPEIADELGVEFLIEGTAQRQDDRVLIRVQLIEAREDTHRWAQSYERELRDFFSVQREIARTVAGEVHVALKPEREPMLAATRPVDPEALDLYLRAVSLKGNLNLVASWGPPAIELIERSVALDPGFAEGWAELAWAHFVLGAAGQVVGSRDDLVRAREAAQRALELDEHLSAAHSSLGNVRLFLDWDFSGARNAYERAVELSPSDPHALLGLALYLRAVGSEKSPEAGLLWRRLLRVAPLDLSFRTEQIGHFLYTREYERGIVEAERIRELDPEFVTVSLGWLYILLGRPEDAVREALAWLARGGAAFDPAREAFERGGEKGGLDGALRALRGLGIEATTQGAFGLAYTIAIQSAVIGETEEAMTWLERAYEERAPMLLLLAKTDPLLDPLRSDPRFDDLLRRIGFPED